MGRLLFERVFLVVLGASLATAGGVALIASQTEPAPRPTPGPSRLDVAAACNCALVRFEAAPGTRIGAVRRVTALDKAWSVRVRDLGETAERWLGDEVLLPAGVYVVAYRVADRDYRLVVASKGPGDHQAIAIPRPEAAPGYRFVPGGACGRDGAAVAPFLLAERDAPERRAWDDAVREAEQRGEDAPSLDQLTCATRLELVDEERPRWARGDTVLVARGFDTVTAARAGQATLRGVRPVSTVVARFAAGEPTEVRPIAAALQPGRYLELVGRACRAVDAVGAFARAGIPATAIWIRDTGPASDLVANVHSAPPAGARRADYVAAVVKPCTGRLVYTDTAVEILDQIEFAPGTARLLAASSPVLDAVAATLEGNPAIQRVEIQSHVYDAPAGQRLALSAQRAAAVEAYLVAHGIAAARLESRGYGDTQPLGCPVELEHQLRARMPVEALRRGGAWSGWAEDHYVLGTLDEACRGAAARNTRIAFLIVKRSSD